MNDTTTADREAAVIEAMHVQAAIPSPLWTENQRLGGIIAELREQLTAATARAEAAEAELAAKSDGYNQLAARQGQQPDAEPEAEPGTPAAWWSEIQAEHEILLRSRVISAEDGALVVEMDDPEWLGWVEQRLRKRIEAALERMAGRAVVLQFVAKGEVE